jgi:hypothetical protein
MTEPSGIALDVAESRRHDALGALGRDLAALDRTPVFSVDGQPMPAHIRAQRAEGRQNVVDRIERLRALSGYELVAEFAPQYLPQAAPEVEPVRFEETLNRGQYFATRGTVGAPVVMADPTYPARYQARQAEQQAQAEHEARIKAGQDALALNALAASKQFVTERGSVTDPVTDARASVPRPAQPKRARKA